MIDDLIDLDSKLLLWFNDWNNAFFDPIMRTLSGKWIWIPFYASIITMIVWRFGWKRALMLVAGIAIAIGLSDFICASIIRPYFQRLRPTNLDNPINVWVHIVDGYRSTRYGFPSCHAANAFALAVSSSLLVRVKNYSIFIIFWALLQCYTRVYLGVHYPGDLLVGAAVGSTMGYFGYLGFRRYAQSYQSGVMHGLPAVGVGFITILSVIIYQGIKYLIA